MKHILSVSQFTKEDIEAIFAQARHFKKQVESGIILDPLAGKISTNLFYEPSTRTSSSFAAAMYRLGGSVISINDVQYSSVAKGETLEDTIRTLEQYCDAIILRHSEVGAARKAAAASAVPIINAGDGIGEHPTQALLDLFTIYEEQGKIDGLTISLVGDLKYGRTVHSLAEILNHFTVTLQLVSPSELCLPDEEKHKITNPITTHSSLDNVLENSDIMYVTRIQKERFADLTEYENLKDSYTLTLKELSKMKQSARIMHPLPRVGEIAFEVDDDPRAAYFRQMKNGLYVRMALLSYALG